MVDLNSLVMAIFTGVLFWIVNDYIPIAPLVSLVFNIFMLVVFILYLMQFFGVIRGILPVIRFKN